MKLLNSVLFIIIFNTTCYSQKTEKMFGKTYQIKMGSGVGDYGIRYYMKSYYLDGQLQFGITLKGLRYNSDTLVMVAKRRVLKDKIIVTEVYKDVENIDSIVRTMYFKNGDYLKSTYKEYYNSKRLPNQPNIKDLLRKQN